MKLWAGRRYMWFSILASGTDSSPQGPDRPWITQALVQLVPAALSVGKAAGEYS